MKQPNTNQGQTTPAQARRVSRGKPKGKGRPHKPHKPHKPAYNRLDDPSQVTGPQTLRQIYQSADAATGLRYGPQERALGLQQAQIPAWFQSYRDQVQGIQTGVKAGYDKAISDVGARQQAVTTGDNAGRAALLGAAQKDAASRGASVDPSLFANDVSAQTVRNQGQADFAGLLSSQGNANNTYFGGLQAAGSAAEVGQNQRVAADRTALAGDKGLFRQGYVSDAQQTAHKNRLEDQAFGLDQYKAASSAANDRSRVRTTRKNAAAQRKATARGEARSVITSGPFAGLTHAQVRKLSPGEKAQRNAAYKTKPAGSKGTAGLTPAQRARKHEKAGQQVTRIEDAESRWNLEKNSKYDFGDGKPRKPTPTEIKQKLGKKFSSAEIHLALMWSSPKPWTAKDRALAKRLGIKLPKKKQAKTTPVHPNP